MSEFGIQPPARELDEFEQLVFEYTSRMGLGNEKVRSNTATGSDQFELVAELP